MQEPVRRGRPRDQQVTRAIVEATMAMLSSTEPGTLSVEAIARRAGVSRPSIYKRWPTLAALLLDVIFEARTQALPADAEQGFPVPDTGSLAGDLRAIVEVGVAMFTNLEHGGVIQALLAASIRVEEVARRFEAMILAPDEGQLRTIFERAAARGEWPWLPGGEPDSDAVLVLRSLIAHTIFERYILHHPIEQAPTSRLAELLARRLEQTGRE